MLNTFVISTLKLFIVHKNVNTQPILSMLQTYTCAFLPYMYLQKAYYYLFIFFFFNIYN